MTLEEDEEPSRYNGMLLWECYLKQYFDKYIKLKSGDHNRCIEFFNFLPLS